MLRELGIRLCALAALLSPAARADFAFRDGDRVAFFGDAVTASRGFTRIVEHYTLMRFPRREVTFINAGRGGDTIARSVLRADHDVFDKGASVVIVAFGPDDIALGGNPETWRRDSHLRGIRRIVEKCHELGVRPFICSPPVAAGDPDSPANRRIRALAAEGLELARSLGAGAIDVQQGMLEIQSRLAAEPQNRTRLHTDDGLHLSDLGHLAMAFVILKGLGAPELVSSLEIDAGTATVAAAAHCETTGLSTDAGGLRFTRLDEGLPFHRDPPAWRRWVPLGEINAYLLKVTGLQPGRYQLLTGGLLLGEWSDAQLAAGIDLSPAGPWEARSDLVGELVDARNNLWAAAFLSMRGGGGDPALADTLRDLETGIAASQRNAARPRPIPFDLIRISGP